MIDYVPGDIVECIRTAKCDAWEIGVTKGELYRVVEMFPCPSLTSTIGVRLKDKHPNFCFCASLFKKPIKGVDIFKLAEPRKMPVARPRELEPVDLYDALGRSW